jgi:segregation and condensation protein B
MEVADEVTKADEGTVPTAVAEEELDHLAQVIESVLFAAAAPLNLRRLVDVVASGGGGKPSPKEVQAAVDRLRTHYSPRRRGIQLVEVAGGYQFRTARENASWVRAVFRDKPARLGRATLETLAIVAYKQPVTRAEIEAIRGVDVDGVLSTLLNRRLIKVAGRKEAVGRPLLYTTTPEFLEVFALSDLSDLPTLQELAPDPEGETVLEPQEVPATEEAAEAAAAAAAPAAPIEDAAAERSGEGDPETAEPDDPARSE